MDAFERFAAHYLSHFQLKPGRSRRIGIEKEILLVDKDGKMANIPEQIWPYFEKQKLEHFVDNYYQKDIAGFHLSNGVLTTDAGLGTCEVILEPVLNVAKGEKRLKSILKELLTAAGVSNLNVLGLGYQPLTSPSRKNWNKKQRYDVLVEQLGKKVNTATLSAADQVHVDISLDEFVPVTNLMNALAGFFMVLFSNSPIREGEVSKPQVFREMIWDDLGKNRTGLPKKPWTSPEEYLKAMWELDCIIAKNAEGHFSPEKKFVDYVEGLSDEEIFEAFCLHEGAIWFCARPRVFGTIETRPTCTQPWDSMMTVPAMMLGLVDNWKEAEEFVKDFKWDRLRQLRYDASEQGFGIRLKGKPVAVFIKELLQIAAKGLASRKEEHYLEPLFKRVEEEKSPADRGIELFKDGGVPLLVKTASLTEENLIF